MATSSDSAASASDAIVHFQALRSDSFDSSAYARKASTCSRMNSVCASRKAVCRSSTRETCEKAGSSPIDGGGTLDSSRAASSVTASSAAPISAMRPISLGKSSGSIRLDASKLLFGMSCAALAGAVAALVTGNHAITVVPFVLAPVVGLYALLLWWPGRKGG